MYGPYLTGASDVPDSALAHVLLRPYGAVVALSSGLFTSVVVASLLDLALPSMAAKARRMTNRAATSTELKYDTYQKLHGSNCSHLLALH